MPKVQDIKAYTKDVFAKAGLGEDETKQVLAAMDNEKFAKAFTDNFKPLPDYSSDMNDVRDKSRAEKDQEYKDWFDKEQVKYQEYLASLNELQGYRQKFPNDRPSNDPPRREAKDPMTQEDIDKLVEAKLQTTLNDVLGRRDSAVLDLLEVREFHMGKFKNSLDVKAFEAAWKEHPEWGGSLKQAYKSFVEPEVKKAEEADWNAKIEAKYQEGIRDGYSRKALPTDHQSNKLFSPMFDRKDDVAKLDERAQETHSREAFFEGLREPAKQSA